VFLTLLLILIPMVWLVVAASAVAACRSASLADRRAAQLRIASQRLTSERQRDRADGPPATPHSAPARRDGQLVNLSV
jgi:hypothetical protein